MIRGEKQGYRSVCRYYLRLVLRLFYQLKGRGTLELEELGMFVLKLGQCNNLILASARFQELSHNTFSLLQSAATKNEPGPPATIDWRKEHTNSYSLLETQNSVS